jgi:hypothetical protein
MTQICNYCNGSGRTTQSSGGLPVFGGTCPACGGAGKFYGPTGPGHPPRGGSGFSSYELFALLVSLIAAYFAANLLTYLNVGPWLFIPGVLGTILATFIFLDWSPVKRVMKFIIKIVLLLGFSYMTYIIGIDAGWWTRLF